MYIIKDGEKIPVQIDSVEEFEASTDWPLIIGITLVALFVVLLIFIFWNKSEIAPKKQKPKFVFQ